MDHPAPIRPEPAPAGCSIERIRLPVAETDLAALAELLVDAVGSGAAVSFLAPLAPATALDWWRHTLAAAHPRIVLLAARDATGLVGSVQLIPAWAPNQPHRADVVKLLVHRRARGLGIGRALMVAVEHAALADGFTLLTLDARRGGVADRLYAGLGWTPAGVIPRYALDTDRNGFHDTIIYYKHLGPPPTA